MRIQRYSQAALGQEDNSDVRVSGLDGSILLAGTSALFFRVVLRVFWDLHGLRSRMVFKQHVFLCQGKSVEEAFEVCFEAWSCSHLGRFN